MLNIEKQPHIQVGSSQSKPVAIVVGDPARVKAYASFCDSYEELAMNRQYITVLAKYKGVEFLIASHGVGSAGAAICFKELIQIGCKTIIRAGTCGALNRELLQQGDLCICNAAAKEDGVSPLLEPQGMPAVASPDVLQALVKTAQDLSINAHIGIALSSDLFYAPTVLPSTLEIFTKCGCDVVEMEVSALFTICRQSGVKCGAILAVDGSPFGWESGDYDPTGEKMKEAVRRMGSVCINAAVALA